MKSYKKRLLITTILFALPIIAFGVLVGLQIRQAALDHALILALKRHDSNSAIRLLNQGADANAQDRPPESIKSRLARLWSRKSKADSSAYPTAFVLWYTQAPKPSGELPEPIPDSAPLYRALIAHGGELKKPQNAAMLSQAVYYHHFPTVKLLLDHHVNPNIRTAREITDSDGGQTEVHQCTPLTWANAEEAKLLIAYGADVNAKDDLEGDPS